MLADIAAALHKFRSSARMDELRLAAIEVFAGYGFDGFLSIAFASGEAEPAIVALKGGKTSPKYVPVDNGSIPDPSIAQHLLETDKPFPIAEEDFGYSLAIPVQAHDGLRGGVLLLPGRTATTRTSREELQFVALVLFASIREFIQATDSHITKREREMLSWAADGKTTDEIAEILGVTPRTVNTHFENASRKLGNGNRLHTVVTAMRMKLIR